MTHLAPRAAGALRSLSLCLAVGCATSDAPLLDAAARDSAAGLPVDASDRDGAWTSTDSGATRPPPVGSHGYFESLVARPDFWRGLSLRPRAGEPVESVYYADQLLDSGYASDPPYYITYDPAGDTHAEAQDAAKVAIRPFRELGHLSADLAVGDTTLEADTMHDALSNVSRDLRIDAEIVTITVARSGSVVGIARAQHGTAEAAHAAGTQIFVSGNSVENALFFPIADTDDDTYLFTWDSYITSDYLTVPGLQSEKSFNIRDARAIWWESRYRWQGGAALTGGRGPQPGFMSGVHAAAHDVRAYSGPDAVNTPVEPQLASALVLPGMWHRFWVHIDLNADGDEIIDQWFATETEEPVEILRESRVTARDSGTLGVFQFEYNTSTDDYDGHPDIFGQRIRYVRNLVILKNPPADWSSLRVRPE